MKYFSSSINGKTIGDFTKYDATLNKYSDRLELVESLITDDNGFVNEFFTTYFSEYYDATPSQKGFMAEQDAVCKTIEGLGTYLLNAKDIDSNRKIKYRFWKSEREFKQYKESKNVNTSTLEVGLEEGAEIVDMFYNPDDKNFKLAIGNKLYVKDINEIKEVAILQKAIEIARDESFVKAVERKIDKMIPLIADEKLKGRLKKIRGNVQNYVTIWIRDMKENQLAIKEAIKRPIKFKSPLKDEGVPNKLDSFDFMVEKDVETLIPFISSNDLMTDIGTLAYDLNQLVDKTKLSNRENTIIGMFREGLSAKDIQDELDIKKQDVKTYIRRIAKKVVKTYEIQVSNFREKERQKKNK